MAERLGQPARFLVVGSGGFALNLCAFSVLLGLGAWYLAASVLAYLLSNAAMYVGNRYFTFGLSHDGVVGAYVRCVVVGAAASPASPSYCLTGSSKASASTRDPPRRSRSRCSCRSPSC